MKRSCVWGSLMLALSGTISGGGCRTTRQEVPPPPSFARDGRKLGGNPVGFGSAPRAGYMTDAATQLAPGIAAPGGDRTSVASRDGLRESPTATIQEPSEPSRKGTIGRMFDGMGSTTAAARRDDAVGKAGFDLPTPASAPLDPPVSLPPPPLIPPPPASSETSPPPAKASGEKSPQPLPHESALPPLVPEPVP